MYSLVEPFSNGSTMEIDKDRFDRLVLSKNIYVVLMDIEEVFAVLCSLFIEFEECLFDLSLRYSYKEMSNADPQEFFEESRTAINVKTLSLLSASRVYNEQTLSRFATLSKLTGMEFDPGASFSREFDGVFSYRVMDGLRNHAMHARLPLGSVEFSYIKFWQDRATAPACPMRGRVSCNPVLIKEHLLKSKKINANTRGELAALNFKQLDLKYLVREYVAALSRCQMEFREWTSGLVESITAEFLAAQSDFRTHAGGLARCVTATSSINDEAGSHYVDPELSARLDRARSAWRNMSNIHTSYVSTEVTKRTGTFPQDDAELWIG